MRPQDQTVSDDDRSEAEWRAAMLAAVDSVAANLQGEQPADGDSGAPTSPRGSDDTSPAVDTDAPPLAITANKKLDAPEAFSTEQQKRLNHYFYKRSKWMTSTFVKDEKSHHAYQVQFNKPSKIDNAPSHVGEFTLHPNRVTTLRATDSTIFYMLRVLVESIGHEAYLKGEFELDFNGDARIVERARSIEGLIRKKIAAKHPDLANEQQGGNSPAGSDATTAKSGSITTRTPAGSDLLGSALGSALGSEDDASESDDEEEEEDFIDEDEEEEEGFESASSTASVLS